ncbi:MAG: hypothetical protein VR64_17200 [Desulfatitalea sp. BRH_c12]|nr:MAG: hypothetical protein VR64_17200 [Desulfatitalea sp. BRH_c12]
MNNHWRPAVVFGLILVLFLLPGGALAQTDSKGGPHGGMMQQKQMGMSGMMGGGQGKGGGGMTQGGNAMLMHGFHRWTHMLMAHAETLDLQRDQLDKIDQMLTGHLTKAIRDRAEVQALTVTLKKDLRAEAIDTKNVEKQLQTIHTKTLQMELDGIRLYTQLRNVLTPEQWEKMQQTIGTPFPAPWEKGRGGMTCPMMQSGNDDRGTEGSSDETSHH